jgi:uncharacterized protein (TIGR02145 family)
MKLFRNRIFLSFIIAFLLVSMIVGCKKKNKVINKDNLQLYNESKIIDSIPLKDCEVKIGNQIWMIQNLNVDTFRNGDIIPEVTDPIEWSKLRAPAWCNLGNVKENGECYGKLYNWYAVNDPRGLAPNGYHIPKLSEWNELVKSLGGVKSATNSLRTTNGWTGNVGTNISGFSAVPASYRAKDGTFYNVGYFAGWWSSTEKDKNYALVFGLGWDIKTTNIEKIVKQFGCSVRCIRN